MKKILSAFCLGGIFLANTTLATAQSTTPSVDVTREDSLEVLRLLSHGNLKSTLDFARQFKGRPYVAFTLEKEPERLIVNLSGLDCATLVETASALAMTSKEGKTTFEAYARNLRNLRYFDGKVDGYLSRLHYLSFWMKEQVKKGRVKEVVLPKSITQPLHISLNYMSRHPNAYKALKEQPKRVEQIAQLERRYSGNVGRFIPKRHLGGTRQQLGAIRDGDIIAIVTRIEGLDYSHQGLAYWGKDGKLHMLHASSDFKKVIEDERPLQTYLNGISHALGIRVFRIVGT